MRTIFVIMDGAGDSGIKTPLSSAKIPSLNYLANNGKCGLIYTLKKGSSPQSDVGVMSLLGYDPDKYYTGRGPLEMHGSGIKVNNFLALRANFATYSKNKIIDRRVGRNLSTKESQELAKAINKIKLKEDFIFKPTVEYRGVLVFRKNLSEKITNTDSAYKKNGKISNSESHFNHEFALCKPISKEGKATADLINAFVLESIKILKYNKINKKRVKKGLLPANIILLRDAGNKLPILPKKRNWIAVNSMPLEIGISKLAGFNVIKAKIDLRGDYYKNLNNISKEAIKAIYKNKNSNFYVHFKETDIPGHDGDFNEKVKMLEFIDKKFFSKIKNLKNTLIVVTADHATPVSLKAHSSDPVPVLIYGKGRDSVKSFNEIACKKGSIHLNHGYELMKLIQNL
jgi:2,3-bisphosphoglycerate-independent phosphoglycerate mutase